MKPHAEYLRRNLALANAIGVHANIAYILEHLPKRPKWIRTHLQRTYAKACIVPKELVQWRDAAPDSPEAMWTPDR